MDVSALLLAIGALALLVALCVWPGPGRTGPKPRGRGQPGTTRTPAPAESFSSPEGMLARQLIERSISAAEYRRVMQDLAERDRQRHPQR